MLKTMLQYKSHQAGIVFEVATKIIQPRLARVAGAFRQESDRWSKFVNKGMDMQRLRGEIQARRKRYSKIPVARYRRLVVGISALLERGLPILGAEGEALLRPPSC